MNAPAAFGTYRVFHQTGSGVQGPVFRAFDSRQDRLVAVKAFTIDVTPGRVVRLADALRDLAASSAWRLPALVPLIEAGIEGTMPFLVMECQTGEGLDVLARRLGPFSIEDAAPILAGIAAAIDGANAVGLRHGALHPRDVFVDERREVRVNGFGIVQAFDRADVPIAARRAYAAPERAGVSDVRADIYSLGVIAHELLTGVRPARRGEQDGAFVPATSPVQRVQLRRALAAALAEDPGSRYASAAAFVDALGSVARAERVTMPVAVPQEAAPILSETAPAEIVPDVVLGMHETPAPDRDVIRPALALTTEPVSPPAAIADARAPKRRMSRPLMGRFAAVGLIAVAFGSGITYLVTRRTHHASTAIDPARSTRQDVRLAREEPAEPASTPTVDVAAAEPAGDARVGVASATRLNIRSEPSGALVTIDGRLSGATPTTVRALSPGTYVVRVARPGHVPREARVTLASAAVRTLTFELEPGAEAWTSALGWVNVDSRPRGADVIIDGRTFGRTPLRVPALRPGAHDVVLRLGGYAAETRQVEVEAGLQSTVSVTLRSLVP